MKRYPVPARFIICCHLLARFLNCTSTQEGVLRNVFLHIPVTMMATSWYIPPTTGWRGGQLNVSPSFWRDLVWVWSFQIKAPSDTCLEVQKYFASEYCTSWYFPFPLSNESEKQEKGGDIMFRVEMLLSISSYALINREDVSERLRFCFLFQRTQIFYQ